MKINLNDYQNEDIRSESKREKMNAGKKVKKMKQ